MPLGPDCGARVPQNSLPCCQAGALITAGTSDAVWLPFQLLPSSLHVHAAAPVKLEGSSASQKRWTKSLCPYQAGAQSWLFLFAMFQSLLGFPCLRKVFVLLEKIKKTLHPAVFK